MKHLLYIVIVVILNVHYLKNKQLNLFENIRLKNKKRNVIK